MSASAAAVSVGLPDGVRLSVPYNHDPGLLPRVEPLLPWVSSLYVAPHPKLAPSARVYRGPKEPHEAAAELSRLARWCGAHQVELVLVANAPVGVHDVRGLAALATDLVRQGASVRVTFSDLIAAERFRRLAPGEVALGVSCLAGVERPVRALYWRERAGAVQLTISREINRRPDQVAHLAGLGLRLAVVAFDDCVPDCPYGRQHYRIDPGGAVRFHAACAPGPTAVRRRHPWLLARKEILPAHLPKLCPWITEVKVAGREQGTGEVLRRLRLYLEARSWVHPNGWYEEPPEAWDRIATCGGECHECTWCADHLRWAPRRGSETAGVSGTAAGAGGKDGRSAGESSAPRREDAPAWSARLEAPGLPDVLLRLDRVHPTRAPVCTVGGLGLYYQVRGEPPPELSALLARVAKGLQGGTDRSSLDRLGEEPLPGGYRITSQRGGPVSGSE